MGMSSADAKFVERVLSEFFQIKSKRVNVSDDATEGEAATRAYVVVCKVEGETKVLTSIADARALVTTAE